MIGFPFRRSSNINYQGSVVLQVRPEIFYADLRQLLFFRERVSSDVPDHIIEPDTREIESRRGRVALGMDHEHNGLFSGDHEPRPGGKGRAAHADVNTAWKMALA